MSKHYRYKREYVDKITGDGFYYVGKKMIEHVGHNVAIVRHSDPYNTKYIRLECKDCGKVVVNIRETDINHEPESEEIIRQKIARTYCGITDGYWEGFR